jgi:hypothetical protein
VNPHTPFFFPPTCLMSVSIQFYSSGSRKVACNFSCYPQTQLVVTSYVLVNIHCRCVCVLQYAADTQAATRGWELSGEFQKMQIVL